MTCQMVAGELTREQKGQITGIISVGCDRQTAANFVGCSLAAIRQAMQRDSRFAADIRHAEATCELSHMRNVQAASKEKGNWKASVWWLEIHSPERFVKRGAGEITSRQLTAFVAILVDVVAETIHDATDRTRLMETLESIGTSVEQMLRESESESSKPSTDSAMLPIDLIENHSPAASSGDGADTRGEDEA